MKSTQLSKLLIIVLVISISKTHCFSQGQFFMTGKKTSRGANSSPQKNADSPLTDNDKSAKKDTAKRKLILGFLFSKGMKTYGDSLERVQKRRYHIEYFG